jgi:hypothetical protein
LLNALTEYLLLVSVFENLDIVDDVDSGRGANQCARDQNDVTKAVGHDQGHRYGAAIPLSRTTRQTISICSRLGDRLLHALVGDRGGAAVVPGKAR